MKDKILKSIASHKKLLAEFETDGPERIIKAVDIITSSIKAGGCIYICGNGGSAADAQHIAGEIVGRFLRERKGLPAVALSTDTSVITCISNDYGFEDIFARQVEALGRKGDVLWAMSTSGTSKNIIKAIPIARELEMKIIGFAGKSGSTLEKLSDVCINVPGQYAYEIQQIHQIAYHIICDLVEQNFTKG
jgi:D-sedoheptulose 7-phosphate isomerase